ncbi:MAG: OmpA family protein [Deltaproteobacteria bacterium]|jgi:OOP family OmpA-OmpF porin
MPNIRSLAPLLVSLVIPATTLAQTPDIPSPPPPPPPAPAPTPTPAPAPKTTEAPPPEKKAPAPEPKASAPMAKAAPAPTRVTTPAEEPPAKGRSVAGRLAVSPSGSTGLIRVAAAESVAPKLIRVSFGLDFFSVGSLFADSDGHSRVGGTLAISGSPVDYVELWLNTRAVSNSNDLTDPTLIQSQGDVALGIKGFYPVADLANVGLDLQLKFLSGVGASSFDFGSTELRVRGLLTTDLMRATEEIPVRGHLNIGFTLDNSDKLVPEGVALTDAERFALGISDFNRFEIGVGVEVPVKYVTPYLEYTVEFPLSYLATPGVVVSSNALRPAQNTVGVSSDIARPAVQRVIPQRITPGVRITAIPKLTLDIAVEIGITPDVGTGVLAVPPYNVIMLASYPLDPFGVEDSGRGPSGPPITVPVIVPEQVEAPPSTGQLAGLVTSDKDGKPIAGAVITFDRGTPVASAADGRFVSQQIEPGPVKVTVSKEGFKNGTGEMQVGADGTVELNVALVPEIKEGTIRGRVLDDKDQPIGNAKIVVEGPTKKTINASESGAFELKALAGRYSVMVDVPDYFKKAREFTLEAGGSYAGDIVIRKRPAEAVAERKGDRIVVKETVHFVSGEARLAPDAAALLDGVVDVLVQSPDIKRLRIEGHTDNVGSEETNLDLSRRRAQAVVDYFVAQGIDASRLSAEGFGSTRPIAPNLTRRGREQNRRVEFHIVQ